MNPIDFVIAGVALVIGVAGGYFFHKRQVDNKRRDEEAKAQGIVQTATDKANKIELEARDRALKITQSAENELNQRRNDLNREVERLDKRRTELDGRLEKLEQREQALNKRQSVIDKRANDVEQLHADQIQKLQQIAEMSQEDARKILLDEVEKEARGDMARIIRQIETEAREEGEKRARK